MDRENIKVKLTEEQKKAKRKKYMREYYLRRNYNMVNGEYKKYKPKNYRILYIMGVRIFRRKYYEYLARKQFLRSRIKMSVDNIYR